MSESNLPDPGDLDVRDGFTFVGTATGDYFEETNDHGHALAGYRTVALFACEVCGAVVANQDKHDGFTGHGAEGHRTVGKALALGPRTRRTCEACLDVAHIRRPDGSTWCVSCNEASIRLGYYTPDDGGAEASDGG